MQYPLLSEYRSAIDNASDNLDQLKHLVVVPDQHGEPYRSNGAFAVVFKMRDPRDGKLYALKCFTEEQSGRAEAYRQITEELEYLGSSYFPAMRYYERELFVDRRSGEATEWPVLLMDWVEGETMELYIRRHYRDAYRMGMLCHSFCKMASWLRSQSFAHGDIKPDNIMVDAKGALTLIDCDGMYVPGMAGLSSPTMGTQDFRHPLRTPQHFDATIDDFALASIALSLRAIALDHTLLDRFGAPDRLLFCATDYLDLSRSEVFAALWRMTTDRELTRLLSLFLIAHSEQSLAATAFHLFATARPEKPQPVELLPTTVSEADLAEAYTDKYGAQLSPDGKRLLKGPRRLSEYTVPDTVTTICDRAFSYCERLRSITLPEGLTSIGNEAFYECESLTSITLPEGLTAIGSWAFSHCSSLTSIMLPESLTAIGDGAFSLCSSLSSITLPEGLTAIGYKTFYCCSSLSTITLPESLTAIGDGAFSYCSRLSSITLPEGLTAIGNEAFSLCSSLSSITLPESLTAIGDGAFYKCSCLTSITLPESLTAIGNGAFSHCSSLTSITLPESLTAIGDWAFPWCSSLSSITLPEGLTAIGDWAFYECKSLSAISLPEGLTAIGDSAFCFCSSLTSITLPEGLTAIGNGAFYSCSSLSSITLPEGLTSIGDWAFCGCSSLSAITLPEGLTAIGNGAFHGCSSLSSATRDKLTIRFGYVIFFT